ncbi:hypothetical protein N7528_003949 [Penicillium herquei]|nr:hypothetical protein N7528_003949 [Penicillium herquei]
MLVTFRVAIAVALVFTIFLVKNHLNSLDQWSTDRNSGPDFILNDAGAHIELVSGDDSKPDMPAESGVRNVTLESNVSSTPMPTTSKNVWEKPTGEPVIPSSFKPKQIPVDVPDDTFDPFLEDLYYFGDEDEEQTEDMHYDMGRFDHNQMPKKKPDPPEPPKPPQVPKLTDRIIVLGRMSWEDSDWLDWELPEWPSAVYVVDDPDAEFHVQQNKGKESNIYLQYIIDHYDKLPDYMVFLHAHRTSAHVEFDEQDNVLTVQRLQLDYVRQAGYANLRCDWGPGCPDEVYPFRQLAGRTTEIAFAGAWIRIFNNTDIPEIVGTPCCAQFAVTREQVHARPLSDYQHFHTWLMETELDDETSGRVFEYLWHIIFGQDPVSCPSKAQCYWDVYGLEYVEPPIDWMFDDSLDSEYYDDEFWGGYDYPDEEVEDDESMEEEDDQQEAEDSEYSPKLNGTGKPEPKSSDTFEMDDSLEFDDSDFDDSPEGSTKAHSGSESDRWQDSEEEPQEIDSPDSSQEVES